MQTASHNKNTAKPFQRNRPIFYRLMIPLCVIVLLLVIALSTALLLSNQQETNRFSQRIVEDATHSLEFSLIRKSHMLNALEDVLLQESRLYEALQTMDREQLLALYGPIFRKLQKEYTITHFYFHLPNRVNLLRLHKPTVHGDVINRFTALEAERSGKTAHGIELGPLGTFTLRVVQPVYVEDTLIGYLELGQEIESILKFIQKRLGVELAVSIRKNVLDRHKWQDGMKMLGRESNWDRYKDEVLVYYSLPRFPAVIDPFIHGSKGHVHRKLTEKLVIDNRLWRIFSHSLQDVSGAEIGDLLVFLDITESNAAFFRLVVITATLAFLLLSTLFIFFYIMLRRIDRSIVTQQGQLIESEGRQRSLLDAINRSGLLIFVVDSEYRIRYMNESMADSFGKEVGGLCYRDVGGYDSPCSHCRIEEVLGQQQRVHYDAKLGNDRSFKMIAVPYVDVDGVPCKLEVMQEITQQRQMEHEKKILEQKLQRAQKMEALGLLAGGVAHDLNNILSGIVSYPEILLLQLPKDSELRESLEAIQESGKRAAAVVEDLLTVARGVARAKEPQDLNLLVKEYLSSPECKTLRSLYPDVSCQQQLEATHSTIVCSSVHIKKSLMNLVTNAAEAIVGAEEILVSTYNHYINELEADRHKIRAGEYVVLSVRDSGTGICDEDLDHIFEPFYTKKVMGRSGTGLGLTVIWNTMEEHEGKVVVESSSKGTCFQLYFPVSSEENVIQIDDGLQEAPRGHGEHILVVDDEPQLRDIASQMLQSLGYNVDSVCSGELAVKFVKENTVDLIVMDMLMEPGMNGQQAYGEILKLYPQQKAIIASGFSESADVKAALQLGASGFIKKPYSINEFSRVVREALNAKR